MKSPIHAPGPLRPRARRTVAALALALSGLSALFACTDSGISTLAPQAGPVHLALVPQFHLLGSSSAIDPINRARLTVLDAASRAVVAGPFDQPVDPSSASFNLPVTFDVPEGSGPLDIVVVVELLNVTNGVESVQWSGVSSTISVSAGTTAPPPAPIDVFQGPPGNLAVTSILITNKPASLVEGDSTTLIAVTQGSGSAQIFWRSSNTSIATVDANTGRVRALANGTVDIIAGAGPRQDTAHISVHARPASIRISPDTARAASTGDDMTFTATVLDSRGDPIPDELVQWTSLTPGVATSAGNGHFTAQANGIATIRATSASVPSVQGTATAVVAQRAASITLDVGAFDFTAVGDRHTFTATSVDARGNPIANPAVQWTSSNPAAVSIDANGVATAVAGGNATITARSADGPTANATVTVRQVASALSLQPASLTFAAVGDTARFVPRVTDHNGAVITAPTVTYISSAPAVATVDATGLVRAISRGSATITATSAGAAATGSVTVDQQAARIDVSPATASLDALGLAAPFTARIIDRNGNTITGNVVWTSTAPGVATIDASGSAVSVGNGVTTITASFGSVTGTATLTVQQIAHAVVVSPDSMVTTGIGNAVAFHADAADALGRSITNAAISWVSLDPGIATVDAAGTVTSTGYGTARIVATAGAFADTATLRVARPTLVIAPHSLNFGTIGTTQNLTAHLVDAGGGTSPVTPTWSSGNTAIATVAADGTVTSTGLGSTIIVGRVDDAADTVVVTVAALITTNLRLDTVFVTPAPNVQVGSTPIIHVRGQIMTSTTIPPTAATVEFLDSYNHVLFQSVQPLPSVSTNTPIYVDAPFTVPVTTLPQVVRVRVTVDATSLVVESLEADNVKEFGPITLTPASGAELVLLPGDSAVLSVGYGLDLDAHDENGEPVAATFTSSNPLVATVDEDGQVLAVGSGYVRIVGARDALRDTVFIRVGNAPWLSTDDADRMFVGGADPENNEWNRPENWYPRGVPSASDRVFIPDCDAYGLESCVSAQLVGNTTVAGIITFIYQSGDDLRAGLRAQGPASSRIARRGTPTADAFSAARARVQADRSRRSSKNAARKVATRGLASLAARKAAVVPVPAAGSDIAFFHATPSRWEEDCYPSVDLGTYVLSITGDVPGFVTLAGTAGSIVNFNGGDQHIGFLAADADVTVSSPELNVEMGLFANGLTVTGGLDLIRTWNGDGYNTASVLAQGNVSLDHGTIANNGGALYIGGTATLANNSTLQLTGDGIVHVTDDFSILSGSLLQMNQVDDGSEISIGGNAVFDGANSVGKLTTGYLEVAHDFTVVSPFAFSPGGDFEVDIANWEEPTPHTVSLGNPGTGAAGNHFNHLYLGDGAPVTFETTPGAAQGSPEDVVFVDGYFERDNGDGACGTVTFSNRLVVAGDSFQLYCEPNTLTAPNIELVAPEDMFLYVEPSETASLITDLLIGTSVHLGSDLSIDGDVTVQGTNAQFDIGSYTYDPTLEISGDLHVIDGGTYSANNHSSSVISGDVFTATGGHVDMDNSNATLRIDGDFDLDGGLSYMSDGRLLLGGNITSHGDDRLLMLPETDVFFTATSGTQTVAVSNNNTIGSVDLDDEEMPLQSDLAFVGDVYLAGSFRSVSARTIRSGGVTAAIHVGKTALVSDLTLDNVALDVKNADEEYGASSLDNIAFAGFTSDFAQLTVRQEIGTSSWTVHDITFDDPATGPHTQRFVELHGDNFTFTMITVRHGNSTTQPGSPQLLIVGTNSTIEWENPS